MDRQELYKSIVEVSGPHKVYKNNTTRIRSRKDLYGSYHYPQFTYTNALRNTLVRFDEFRCPLNLADFTVFDLGSNLGSLSFEALRRSARFVTGFEYVKERIELCERLADYLGCRDRCSFVQVDLLQALTNQQAFTAKYGRADIVFCCALDAYLPEGIYQLAANSTRELCFFETNNPKTKGEDFRKKMRDNGFVGIEALGASKSDAGTGRRSYILDKKVEVKRRMIGSDYDHITYRLEDQYITALKSKELWLKLKDLYDRISHIKYVAKFTFEKDLRIVAPAYSGTIFDAESIDKEDVKRQVVELVVALNQAGVAHRDMHVCNIAYDAGQIYLLDLEFLEEDPRPLASCYDMTGTGLESPLKSNHMHIFHSGYYSLSRFLDIRHEDFDVWR